MTTPADPAWALRVQTGPVGRVEFRKIAHLHELADDGSEVLVIASESEMLRLVALLQRGIGFP